MRRALTIFAALYVAIGAYFGTATMRALPATNLAGGLYVAATWPAWIKGSPIRIGVPTWCFTFEDRT